MSGRREEAKDGTRRCRDTAFTRCVWESPRSQCGQGGFVLLALVGPAVHLLGDSAPRWPAGSPAQWQRPRMWICAPGGDRAILPPSQAGVGFGLWLGSPVCFLPKLGRRGIKLRRKQGPTGGGVRIGTPTSLVHGGWHGKGRKKTHSPKAPCRRRYSDKWRIFFQRP